MFNPYGLTAGNGTSSSVDVSWTGGPNASYTVEYGVTGFTQGRDQLLPHLQPLQLLQV